MQPRSGQDLPALIETVMTVLVWMQWGVNQTSQHPMVLFAAKLGRRGSELTMIEGQPGLAIQLACEDTAHQVWDPTPARPAHLCDQKGT